MSTFKVPVVRVNNIERHPGADTLSMATIEGCPTIFGTEMFKDGNLGIYVPVDAVVPETVPGTEFLGRHRRIKAKKLRGIFSMGLLLPITAIEGRDTYLREVFDKHDGGLGHDVAPLLGITKYEEPEPLFMQTEQAPAPKTPNTPPVYDMESFRKYHHLFAPGEEVYVSEKIHGCVRKGTAITMADGSSRRMKDVQIGDYVLGMNGVGASVASRVIQKFDNGKSRDWIDIRVTNNNAGRGLSYRTLCCTPNHKIFSPTHGDYVAASSLSEGDTVLVNRLDMELPPLQREVLVGKMLGDGSADKSGRSISWGHAKKHKEYSDWTASCLGQLAHPTEQTAVSGYDTKMVKRRTVSSGLVKLLTDRFFAPGSPKKIVPSDIELTPISLAFWYMDDGSLGHDSGQHDRALFATCGFSINDCKILKKALARLGIEAVVYESKGPRIRLNATDAEKLFLLISAYVPPCMQYKLPERFRGAAAWFPRVEHKPALVEQKVVRTKSRKEVSGRWDMETETHNYFAGGILVHNCNARFVYWEGQLHCGSHKQWKKMDERSVWWKVAKAYNLEERLKRDPGMILYGEIYGRVQDLHYGAKLNELFFRAFDVYHTGVGQWLSYLPFVCFCDELEVPRVPTLYKGPYTDFDALAPFAEGQSTLADHIKEGFVIKPTMERWNNETGRTIAKLISPEYLLRKGGTEHH